MQWEYMYVQHYVDRKGDKVVHDGNKYYYCWGTEEFLIKKLDALGAIGWEAVGITSYDQMSRILLKRQR
jgi:hypothetical protein